ncbi:hypothetical protein Q5752_000070 [Cryptotrichosporon argae]
MPDQPAGGHDDTPLRPISGASYTLRFTFHRARNLPVADYAARSADPYVLARVHTGLPTRHAQDPPLRFRTATVRRSVDPQWDTSWVVAGVPAAGCRLEARLMDEDPDDHDDRLGKVVLETGALSPDWPGINRQAYPVRKRGASWRAYGLRSCMTLIGRDMDAELELSVEMVGETKDNLGKSWTDNCFWWRHYSPLIGRLAGTKALGANGVEQFDFQANEIQLKGPVPNELYHRFVDFKKFVHGMFEATGVRGRLLHKALHHQHERIYIFDKKTERGELEGPGREMTLKFLDMCHFDEGGRIFTYVVTLDGLFRFTETGKEFGIDLLSKHTMHSDVNIYIAWSGEFLIRRLKHPHESSTAADQETHGPSRLAGGPPDSAPPQDPAAYELIIDNDSGTYRPLAKYIPVFHDYLKRQFPDLHIRVMDCTSDELSRIKDEQRALKRREGDTRVFGQQSRSDAARSSRASLSSGDMSDLDDTEAAMGADAEDRRTKREKAVGALEDPKAEVRGVLGKGPHGDRGEADGHAEKGESVQAASGPRTDEERQNGLQQADEGGETQNGPAR